jgi:hypothetical protein
MSGKGILQNNIVQLGLVAAVATAGTILAIEVGKISNDIHDELRNLNTPSAPPAPPSNPAPPHNPPPTPGSPPSPAPPTAGRRLQDLMHKLREQPVGDASTFKFTAPEMVKLQL